jgi:uncharacterized protein YdaU (DUF1376 family)
MAELDLEERGAYNTVLDLIYATAGDLVDDDRQIAKRLRCDIRVWRRIRNRLIELEKLYVHAGRLRNKRADQEIYAAQHRAISSAEAGRKSWEGRREVKWKGQHYQRQNRAAVITDPRNKERKNNTESTESEDSKRKEDANRTKQDGTRKMEPTDALAETIKRKGWTQ